MRFEVKDDKGKRLGEFNDYHSMWCFVAELHTRLGNIDGYMVMDHEKLSMDYAWRVARNMNDLWINE